MDLPARLDLLLLKLLDELVPWTAGHSDRRHATSNSHYGYSLSVIPEYLEPEM